MLRHTPGTWALTKVQAGVSFQVPFSGQDEEDEDMCEGLGEGIKEDVREGVGVSVREDDVGEDTPGAEGRTQ